MKMRLKIKNESQRYSIDMGINILNIKCVSL